MRKMLLIKIMLVVLVTLASFESFTCFNEDLPCPMYPVYAQTASPSASLKDKIKALQTEIASRAAQLKQDVNKKLQNKVYVGVVQSKSPTSLVLVTRTGNKNITINEYTDYVGDNKITAKTLAENDYVAALGDVDDNEVLIAKRIVRLPTTTNTERQVVAGTIMSFINPNVTLKTHSGQTLELTVDKSVSDKVKLNKAIIAVTTKKIIRFIQPMASSSATTSRPAAVL